MPLTGDGPRARGAALASEWNGTQMLCYRPEVPRQEGRAAPDDRGESAEADRRREEEARDYHEDLLKFEKWRSPDQC